MMRYGRIADINYTNGVAKVALDEVDIITDWATLPKALRSNRIFTIGQQVAVLYDGEDYEILNEVPGGENNQSPSWASNHAEGYEFADGTKIVYDTLTKQLTVTPIESGKVVVAGDAIVSGNQTVMGDLVAGATGIEFTKNFISSINPTIPPTDLNLMSALVVTNLLNLKADKTAVPTSVAELSDAAQYLTTSSASATYATTSHYHVIGDITGLSSALSALVPQSRTISGLSLTSDISQSALQTALGLGSGAYGSTAYLPLTGGTLTGDLNGTDISLSGGLEARQGAVFAGQYATFPTGIGTYVANYVSSTYGARILAYDGSSYQKLSIGASLGANFQMELAPTGNVRFANTVSIGMEHGYSALDIAGEELLFGQSAGLYLRTSLGAYASIVGHNPKLNPSYNALDIRAMAGTGNGIYLDTLGNIGFGKIPTNKFDFNGALSATTANFSNLTAGYIPYQTASGLANSNIYSDGIKVGIKTTTPEYDLDVNGSLGARGTATFYNNVNLNNTTYASQTGIINKGGIPFLHDFNYGNNGTVTTIGHNLFLGVCAGNFTMGSTATSTTHSSYNTIVGNYSLYNNTLGYYNTTLGYAGLYRNTEGFDNVAIGFNSLYYNTTGYRNTAIGSISGLYIADGATTNATGYYNTFIGAFTKPLANGDYNETVIGYGAIGAGSNSVMIGNSNVTDVYFGGSNSNARIHAQRFALANTTNQAYGLLKNNDITAGGTSTDIWLYNNTLINIYGGTGINLKSAVAVSGALTLSDKICTASYVSEVTGWQITNAGAADFRSIYTDALHAKAFIADISQALAGEDFLTKSVSKLSENFTIPAVSGTATFVVDDLQGFPATRCFVDGDYIRFREIDRSSGALNFGDVWGTVVLDTSFGSSGFLNGRQRYTFTCISNDSLAGYQIGAGAEVLDYGTSGSGVIERTVLDTMGSPYSQIKTWTSDPSVSSNYTVWTRLGNLAGITNCSGFGLYAQNAFLTGALVVGDLTKTNNFLSYENGVLTISAVVNVIGGSAATTTDVSNAQIAAQLYAVANCIKTDASNAPSSVLNSTINIGSNGALSGAGGGQVTISGLGYSGDLDATKGATWGANISNQPSSLNDINSSEYTKFTYIDSSGIYTGTVTASQVLATGAFIASNISGLGALATLNTVSTSLITGLGALATKDNITASYVTDLGALATKSNIDHSYITDIGALATLNNVGLTNLNSTLISGGKIISSLIIANEVLTNALVSGTVVAGTGVIDYLTLTNATVSGVINVTGGNAATQTYVGNSLDALLNKNGTQLLPNNWTVGTDAISFYDYNQSAPGENARVIGTNHLGQSVVLWECLPSGDGNADGGWDSNNITIDPTKTYRFSVFAKKSDSNGTFYLGCGGNSVCDLNTSTQNSNPYFYAGNIGFNGYDKWYLIIGYVYPAGVTGLANNGEVWDCQTGQKISSSLTCFNWYFGASQTTHRSYLYYCSSSTTRQYMYAPRVDLVDGNEPSVAQLLGMSAIQSYSDSTQTSAQNNLANKLGYTDYATMVSSVASAGTIISGGYINTSLLAAQSILADKILTTTITSLGAVTAGSFNLGSGKFQVDTSGYLTATGATITGAINATSGYIGDASAGWLIGSSYLYNDTNKAGLAPADYPFYAGQTYTNRATAPFRVDATTGKLTASNAVITGEINASTGTLGTLTMNSSGKINLPPTWGGGSGTIDNLGIHLRGKLNEVSQAIDWWDEVGNPLASIYPYISTHWLAINAQSGIAIGNIYGEPVYIGTDGLSSGGIKIGNEYNTVDFNNSYIKNVKGVIYYASNTISLTGSNAVIYTNGASLIIITSNSSSSNSIYKIYKASGVTPVNGSDLEIINTTDTAFDLRSPNEVTGSNIRTGNEANFTVLKYSIVKMKYYGGYWYCHTDHGQ